MKSGQSDSGSPKIRVKLHTLVFFSRKMIRAFAIASAFALVAIATQIDDSRPEPCSCRDTALVCSLPVTFKMSTRSGRLLIQEYVEQPIAIGEQNSRTAKFRAPGKGANATCLNRNLWKNVATRNVEVLQKR